MAISKSMFLPQPAQGQVSRSQPAELQHPQMDQPAPDPLGGGMAQSMVLSNQGHPGQRAQTMGRAGARRLDERQAAKLLAGGF